MTTNQTIETEQADGRVTAGRKGLPYDWQALVAEGEIAHLEAELAALSVEAAR